jgi:hypothetical protein
LCGDALNINLTWSQFLNNSIDILFSFFLNIQRLLSKKRKLVLCATFFLLNLTPPLCQNSTLNHKCFPKPIAKAKPNPSSSWCVVQKSEPPSRPLSKSFLSLANENEGKSFFASFHQSIISLALKTNELDENVYLSISLPIMVKWNPPHQMGFRNPFSPHLECNP